MATSMPWSQSTASQFLEILPIVNMEASTVTEALMTGFFTKYRMLTYLHSDQGTQFELQIYKEDVLDARHQEKPDDPSGKCIDRWADIVHTLHSLSAVPEQEREEGTDLGATNAAQSDEPAFSLQFIELH